MAVSQGRTTVSQGMIHYCNVHTTFLDKNHMSSCNLKNEAGDLQDSQTLSKISDQLA
ncbi:hypothetical protein OXYTRIMIC_545 [Oxytricha trifallax]|uniref:Uncharacterized protein n=1 Tax=Oxytricha trifallax TaxID=1172189 RepID=A0A073IB77_9SPIT|nr:hypothetical protein OXYTRIMIC_545 [Oxytricha trifallax]